MRVSIVVNGKQHDLDTYILDYLGATVLAFPGSPHALYTVTWKRPDGGAGSLVHGQRVGVTDGTIVNVMTTNRA
jgi:hypothetical protein